VRSKFVAKDSPINDSSVANVILIIIRYRCLCAFDWVSIAWIHLGRQDVLPQFAL
jgi:hypothetical protein